MRVLQLSTSFAAGGGIQTHVSDLSAWLLGRGHHVSMAGTPGTLANSEINPDFFLFVLIEYPAKMRQEITTISLLDYSTSFAPPYSCAGQ